MIEIVRNLVKLRGSSENDRNHPKSSEIVHKAATVPDVIEIVVKSKDLHIILSIAAPSVFWTLVFVSARLLLKYKAKTIMMMMMMTMTTLTTDDVG